MRHYLTGFMDGFAGVFFDLTAAYPYRRGWVHGSRCAGWRWL